MLNRTDYLQPIAAAGFAVFMPAFRGSGGYEQDFVHANVGDFADGPLDDCLRGLDSLVKKGVADPARLAVAGASYGGYLTLYALTQTSRFRCGVCICGLSDLISDTASGSRPTFIREYYGRYPWEAPEMIWRISPLSRVADVSAPLLLLHGEADVNTPVHHARELEFALRVLGRPFRFRSYPGEGHGLDRPAVRLDVVAEMVRWLDAHLVANPA
jgi:dipeptidyl aminopeptidase/acylaminoacyl peptidase